MHRYCSASTLCIDKRYHMEDDNSLSSLLSDQATDGAPENNNRTVDAVAQQRSTVETSPTTDISERASADEGSLVRSYSSASSGNSADTTATMSADQQGARCSQWALKEMSSSASISSLGSSASLSCSELSSLARVDKNLFHSSESPARFSVGVSAGTSSREKGGSSSLAGNRAGGPGVIALVDEQQQGQEKQEKQSPTTRCTKEGTYLELEAERCVNTGGSRSRDFTYEKAEGQKLQMDSSDLNWRTGRNESEKAVAGVRTNTPWRSITKLEGWRTSRNKISSKNNLSDNSESSSLFSAQLEKAIANLANVRVGPTGGDRMKNSDSESRGLKQFATEVQRMTNKSVLTGAVNTGAENGGLSTCAGRSSGDRTETQAAGAGRHSTTPETSQNAYGRSFLLPPDIVAQDYVKRPTSAPPTLSKFSASTLFAFPPCDSADNGPADLTRNELCYQFWRELCQTSPGHPSLGETTSLNQKFRKAAESDRDMAPAAAAAAASLLQEQQGNRMDLKQLQELLHHRGQKTAFASEHQRRNEQRQLAAAALKLAGTKQFQRGTSVANRDNDDCVSLAVAAVAAALLRESQPSWRDDNDILQTSTGGARPDSRAGLQVLSASRTGEGSLSTVSVPSTVGPDTPRDPEPRRLISSFPNDCARGSRSLQPTSSAATAAVANTGGKQDFAVSLSVPHSPLGLSSVLSSPCSSKAPARLPRPSADHSSRSSGNNLLDAGVAEATGCFGNSPRKPPAEPRLLHEHHRLLLSLPHDCDDDSNNVKGGHTFGTTPRITVVKIDDEKQTPINNSGSKASERRLSALDAAARVLVSAAAGSKAEMLLQQLENEEREVFRCASAPPGESAASLLCSTDIRPLLPNVQGDAGRVDANKKDQSFFPNDRTAEQGGSESNSSGTCPENASHSQVSQNTLGTLPAEPEQRKSVCVLEEEDVAATSTGELFNKGIYASSSAAALSAPTPQQVESISSSMNGTNGAELQHQQPPGILQAQTDDSMQTRGVFPAVRFPVNSRVDAPALVGGGSGGYPPLYNPPTMIPGHQFCVPPTAVPGCWEEDHAALFVTRRAADVAGAMAAAYGPPSPHSGVFLGHPPMVIPLGTSTAAEIQQQAMRAAAGAFFLQHQSAAVAAAAAAAAHRGNSHEWARSAMMQPLGRGTGGNIYYGGGTCCGVGGVGLASSYPNGERYFPDPLTTAATFAAIDSYNWARVNNFPGGPGGYHDGQTFGGGSTDLTVANAGDGLEDLSKYQQLQQPLPTWAPDGSESTENVAASGDRVVPESSRTTRSPRLTSSNCGKQQARESFARVDMTAEESFDRAPSSTEDRGSRGGWTTPSCDWSGDRPLANGESFGAAGATNSRGKIARSDLSKKREEETAGFGLQIGADTTLTRERFRGHVAALARDQLGCRLLQRVIAEGGDPADVQIIYNELLEDAAELMLDPFGNYLVQKVFEALSEDQFRVYLTRASPRLVKACLSTHGTRAVQKVVEVIAKQADPQISLKIFVDAVEPALPALVRDSNANHVIQKVLTTLPPSYCDFVFSHVENHCVAICKERHGCCVVQRCIDAAGRERKKRLLAIISRNAVELVQDSFGNYVVQYVLELHLPTATDAIMANLKGNICALSKQKFSSNVVEKCLVHGTAGHVRAIVEELLEGGEEQFRDLLLDQYGNYVVQRALTVSHPSGQEILLRAISPCLPHLKRTSAGGCVAHRLIKRFPSLASSSSPVHCLCTVPGRRAASPALVEALPAKESTPMRTNHTPVNACEDGSKSQLQNPANKKLDGVNSFTNAGGTAGTWNGAQNRFAEGREGEDNSSWPAVPKALKRHTQQRDTVVHTSSKRRQPESCTTTWAPISRAIGIPAGRKNSEKKRSDGLAFGIDDDKGERRRSSFWVSGSTLDVQSGRSSRSCEQSTVMEMKPDRPRDGKISNTRSELSASSEVISKVTELRGQNFGSWHIAGGGGEAVIQEKRLNGSAGAGMTASCTSTAVPRAGRQPSTKKHNKHRPVKPLHVSLA